MNKIVSLKDAISLIKSGSTLAIGGFVGTAVPDYLLVGLENQFLESNYPQDLFLFFAGGQGEGGEGNHGVNHLAHEGLVNGVIAGHFGLVPKLQKMAVDNKIVAYNFPMGMISHMYRDMAAHKPRTISHVGLQTFADPRVEGGKVNDLTTEDIVELIEFDGKEYLSYKHPESIDVCFIRGTTADAKGNMTMEKEALIVEALEIAQATKNSGGKVIVQVERIAKNGSLNPKEVIVPGIMVDAVVVCPNEEIDKYHRQTYDRLYDPVLTGEIKTDTSAGEPIPLSIKKIIARRAALELTPNDIVNLGVGVPEFIANVAKEEGLLDTLTLTAEPGVIGGIPQGGPSFGTSANLECLVSQPQQFDFYQGEGLDICFLGLAECDQFGNLNVSKFGPRLPGCGGFVDISQNSPKCVFLGTFNTKGLQTSIVDGELVIDQEGTNKKFVENVEQITFSGNFAKEMNKNVMYITERCVFQLTSEGLELIEVAPGIDIQTQILDLLDFEPIVNNPKLMDERIFIDEPMDIYDEIMDKL